MYNQKPSWVLIDMYSTYYDPPSFLKKFGNPKKSVPLSKINRTITKSDREEKYLNYSVKYIKRWTKQVDRYNILVKRYGS